MTVHLWRESTRPTVWQCCARMGQAAVTAEADSVRFMSSVKAIGCTSGCAMGRPTSGGEAPARREEATCGTLWPDVTSTVPDTLLNNHCPGE
jgi:hypothetical protein